MNMITVLLGATGVLLLVALGLSFGAMNKGVDEGELRAIEEEVARLNAAEAELALLRQQRSLGSTTAITSPPLSSAGTVPIVNPVAVPAVTSDPILNTEGPDSLPADEAELIADLEQELAEKEREAELLKTNVERAEKKAETYKNEAGIAWQSKIEAHDKDRARGETIRKAMLMARVKQYSEESGFAVIDIMIPERVEEGTTLAIRRQTGIYGQVKVSQLYEAGQAVADPIPSTFYGEQGIDIQPGDELIIPPQ
jgi:hypothetical protein